MVDKPFLELDVKSGEVGIPQIAKGSPYLGLALLAAPACKGDLTKGSNQFVKLNFTGTPGSCSDIYFALLFQLGNWGYHVEKVDEWISISPEHYEYYQRVSEQKRQLEAVIKTGLGSAAQAVADFELINHDLRKYKEILNYFSKKDEHSLKAMFIDQVDIHTGEGISLRSIVGRWPTVIADFMKLADEDLDPDTIAKKINVSKAEGVILTTKNKLYQEWKKMFREATVERYNHIKALVSSRKKTIDEYRKWLKPYISRFKMMKLGEERPEVIKSTFKSFVDITGQATFSNFIRIWAWKPFKIPEARKIPVEKSGEFLYPPNDPFVVNNYIKNPVTGLANIYPWLLKKKNGETVADKMIKEILGSWNEANSLDPNELYYVFLEIDVERSGLRTQTGEIEDIVFFVKTYMMSQNILLVKLLESKCREHEMEKYIDEILGIRAGETPEEVVKRDFPELYEEKPKKKPLEDIRNPLKSFTTSLSKIKNTITKPFAAEKRAAAPLLFFKKGIYERDFTDRIIKFFLIPMGVDYFGPVKGFLMGQMGIE